MSLIINTFLDKDNLIKSRSTNNLGRNPITELYYGDNYSRYIIHFDETNLKQKYNNGYFPDLNKLTHTLKLFNCGAIESELIGGEYNGKYRATSFDLIIYELEQEFDEGIGYDFENDNYISGDKLISTEASNWYNSTTLSSWETPGASNTTGSTYICSYHFDWGNENPEFDITNYINNIITGNTNNYGLCIQFPTNYEELNPDNQQYVGFFSRHTHTFFEPYVQTVYDETILDDRNKFYLDKVNRLYLYSTIGGEQRDLDSVPTCTIVDSSDTTIFTPTVVKAGKGIYYVEVTMDSTTYDETNMFYDQWSGLVYNGNNIADVELEFVTRGANIYFNVSDNDGLPIDYHISLSGIKPSEDILRGDVRKVLVIPKIPYTKNQSDIIDGLEYRIYVKEGLGETTVIDYTSVERTFNHNYFIVDTNNFVAHKYFIDIRLSTDQVQKHFKDVVSFNIVNETSLRYI